MLKSAVLETLGANNTEASGKVAPGGKVLMAQGAKEIDPDKRKAIYSEFQQILAEDLPVYWTNTLPYHTIYSTKVGNPPLGIWASGSPYDLVYLKE